MQGRLPFVNVHDFRSTLENTKEGRDRAARLLSIVPLEESQRCTPV